MPQFQYTPFVNPYVPTIANLLEHQGDPAARAAENIAAARAHSAEVGGRAWAGAAQTVGEAIGAIPQQIQRGQVLDLQKQELQAKVKSDQARAAVQQRDLDAQQYIGTTLSDPANHVIGDDGQPTNQVDHAKVADLVAQKYPKAAQAYLESVEKTQEHAVGIQEKMRAIATSRQEALSQLAQHAADQMTPDADPEEVRQRTIGQVAAAASQGLLDPKAAQAFLQQTQDANPEQLKAALLHVAGQSESLRAKRVEEEGKKATTAKNLAEAAKLESEARTGPPRSVEQAALDAFAQSIGKKRGEELSDAERQQYDQRKADFHASAASRQHAQERLFDVANPIPEKVASQDKLEQEYRTVLQRTLTSRNGGMGLEDAKVNQAQHLMAIFEGNKDPKTGEYTIPRVLQAELALGLARLTSPNGQVGEGMMKEFEQKTAKGDLAALYTWATGQPVTGSTQAIFKMFKDSIERQGGTAERLRENYFDTMRALAPTGLDEDRRIRLEAGLKLARMGGEKKPAADGGSKVAAPAGGNAGEWVQVAPGVRVRKKS